MSDSDHTLPDVLPIFPLAGVLLLPRSELPLHIFEPRYRAMTRDALAGARLIGMIQPRDPATTGAQPEVYPTGCAGRIAECRKTEDGRYNMTLVGFVRFRVREELPLHDGYRRVVPDYAPFADDLGREAAGALDRPRLLRSLGAYAETIGFAIDWDVVRAASDERIVASLAMLCPFEPSEKQALLEAPTLGERARVLLALLEFAHQSRGVETPALH